MNALKTVVLTLAALTVPAVSLAADAGSRNRIEELQHAKQRVAQSAETIKPGQRHSFVREERRLQALIDDLQAGKAVDPAEIDRALKRASRPGW